MSNDTPTPQAPLSRQELYQQVREQGKKSYILAEMQRLGFWDGKNAATLVPESKTKRRKELCKQLNELTRKQKTFDSPEAALKTLRSEQMAAAKEKREDTKKKNAEARYQKKLAWHERQQNDINWLGEAVSLGLDKLESDNQKLQNNALPNLETHAILAEKMGVSINELRFLAYQRQTSKVCHYKHFQIAKKQGGFRSISSPMPRLKRVQYWILDNILNQIPLHDSAHGFITNRSILTNAIPHVGKSVVINLDLKDFFPTITYKRVKGLFHKTGYSESLSTVLALLCSEPSIEVVELDGERWFLQQGERYLPQGAPTSPAISNLLCRTLDRRLQGLANKYNFTYTRYADDLTFSADKEGRAFITKLLWAVRSIVTEEGFHLHPDKTRIMHSRHQQEVTGLVVNNKLAIDRSTLRRFRALIHQIEQNGLQGKSWNGHTEPAYLIRSILGFANFITMVNPKKGKLFKQKAQSIHQKYGNELNKIPISIPMGVRKNDFRRLSAAGKPPIPNLQQAAPKPTPVKELTSAELKQRKAEQHSATIIKQESQNLDSRESSQPNHTKNTSQQTHTESSKVNLGKILLLTLIVLITLFFTSKAAFIVAIVILSKGLYLLISVFIIYIFLKMVRGLLKLLFK
jgi:retron-type reverse transcriptase